MNYRRIAGIEKDISQIVIGTHLLRDVDHATPIFDEFVLQGGNCFDIARHYGDAELVFGQWLRRNGHPENLVVITKGAHSPNCYPEFVTSELLESLERLRLDSVDIYFLHRDNLEVPVGEFVDVLNEHKNAGRINQFGGSNWTPQRIDDANEYAARNGLDGFTVLSNQMSLARMVEAPWEGCLTASDIETRKWLSRRKIPLFPWSSQARGFFVEGRAAPDKLDDSEMVRCWYSEDNFERLSRAREIAKRRGWDTVSVALAYLLHQPTPVYPLIGPLSVSEINVSLAALDVRLSDSEVRWLNLETHDL
tara:strand:- start:1159 stop:2079 length:921 start_codon:yes stop_codon:yes gene_type:complete